MGVDGELQRLCRCRLSFDPIRPEEGEAPPGILDGRGREAYPRLRF